MAIDVYHELLLLIEYQSDVIKRQNEVIFKLVNENAEQENMINVMMQEQIG